MIRPEAPPDIPAIHALTRDAFEHAPHTDHTEHFIVDALRAAGCVVLGEPSYYGRFGFRVSAKLVLPGVPPEYFQALHWTGAMPAGEVNYHPAFNALG